MSRRQPVDLACYLVNLADGLQKWLAHGTLDPEVLPQVIEELRGDRSGGRDRSADLGNPGDFAFRPAPRAARSPSLGVYHWFVRQALTGSRVIARKPTGEEVALETAELSALEGKGNRLSPEELGLLAKELATASDPIEAARIKGSTMRVYFPTACERSRSFSRHTYSSSSVSAARDWVTWMLQGLV